MTGKIFPESNNIYQDQARILFSYYQQAAEKIVGEEERIEKEIALLEREKVVKNEELSKAIYWLILFFLLVPIFIYLAKKNSLTKEIADLDVRILEFSKQHAEIFRDYKVSKLGVAYVPVADQIKYEDKSFIVDYTGGVAESEVTLQLSKQNDLLISTIADLENLSTEAPIVETSHDIEEINTEDYSRSMQQINQHDYFGKLERSLRTISYCMGELDTTSVSLPLVADNSEYLQTLKEYATSEIPDNAPIITVFDNSKYANSISKFQELNRLKDSLSTKTTQFEDVLKGLMMTMANSVQAISSLKVASTDKVIAESNRVLYQILKSPYNHYSPTLEYSEIERIRNEKFDYGESVQSYEPFHLKPSSKVKYNLLTGMWTTEDGSTSHYPFGVHQIYEEIVAPVVQNLMQENRIERLKIYNHIKDQKIDYLNKWHQDTDSFYRANRAESADVVNLMQESLREYVAAYNTLISLQKTEESMAKSGGSLDSTVVEVANNSAETLLAFEMQAKQFQAAQANFEEYMDRLKEDIDIKAEKFGHIEYYDARLRDGHSSEVAVAASEVCDLDERRRPLAMVNPLFAKVSELPPVPNIEDVTLEHMSLNLPVIAKNALEELNADSIIASETLVEPIVSQSTTKEANMTLIDTETMDSEIEIEERESDVVANQEGVDLDMGSCEAFTYSEEVLYELSDDRLKEICDELAIEYDGDDFDRDVAISDILDSQGNSENE